MNTGKVVKIRFVKKYKDAKNHVCIGEVKRETANYIAVKGVTFHFGSVFSQPPTLGRGKLKTRWIPWHQIEIVTELPADLDWMREEFTLDEGGDIILRKEAKPDETAFA